MRLLTIALAATLTLAACGSDEAGPGGSTTPDLTIPPDIVLDGDGAPLFGGAAAAEAVVDPAVEPCLPDDVECQQRLEPDALPPPETFVPAPVNAEFCALLADIETRPMPTDEFDQIRVVRVYLADLSPTVPRAIHDEFEQVVRFVESVIAGGRTNLEDISFDPQLETAFERIDAYVASGCHGR